MDRPELLRDALRRHLVHLSADDEVTMWLDQPLDDGEQALAAIADWPVLAAPRTPPPIAPPRGSLG